MNALVNSVITLIVFGASYTVMTTAGLAHDVAMSTAILVAATGALPMVKGTDFRSAVQERKRHDFERRLEVSKDKVKLIARETYEEVRKG